ncbi:hypothetical protein LB533_15155 [Mesorhizobium sp. BR1-1-13]|uniref:hypothetical protein n=1 Tax=Mesorhizobium sp. BR1-1-13 TaxID=2876656 RepID=UPI001CD06003|nr:hypothetical protein [Mesorhizobium sp. BR1-1-13]MBZ9942432.1 hypothetical protein [Mesorhizobium sp. BR1-1-13]
MLMTASGLPVIVECKLWRNPEGRREVVGQILDYAKEITRWSSSDLQREVRRNLKRDGNPLLDLLRQAKSDIDEIEFNDALTKNLRLGRFLLLIVGDGIREGVEAITEYLLAHAGLHFSMGLVELPIYVLPDGSRLVVPRILARTEVITREVLAIPEGYHVAESSGGSSDEEVDAAVSILGDARQRFWAEFLSDFHLDDPEQSIPKPGRAGHLSFMFPAPNGSSWLTAYRDAHKNEVGVFLSSSRNSAGEYAMKVVTDQWDEIKPELGKTARIVERDGRPTIRDSLTPGSLDQPDVRKRAFEWLADRVNTFVNVLRPRIRSAVLDFRTKEQ